MSETPIQAPPVPAPPTSLLKVQVGPVQDFISQARTTRDLWSGSYLLSWLVAQAIHAIRTAIPSAKFIYPAVDSQPILQFFQGGSTTDREAVLTPNIPNLFVSVLPSSEVKKAIELLEKAYSFHDAGSEWRRICNACLHFLDNESHPFDDWQRARWAFQLAHHWQVTWQVWPELSASDLDRHRHGVGTLTNVQPSADGWNENYHIVSHRLDARRQLRDFESWERTPPPLMSAFKFDRDHLSGKEEALIDKGWLENARKSDLPFRFLFRANDALGAVNLLKRVWHKAYLDPVHKLHRQAFQIESIPAIAASPFRSLLGEKLRESPNAYDIIREFADSVVSNKSLLDEDIRSGIVDPTPENVLDWVAKADSAIYNDSTWDPHLAGWTDEADITAAKGVLAQLRELKTTLGLVEPGCYYAVIAMDGDEMGKWVSGEMAGGEITREFHTEFSRKLSEFALGEARKIVESHHGRLIFAGGDDVVALLPAPHALDCALDLAAAFAKIQPEEGGRFLTASSGIAIGHIKAPLQDMIGAAQQAEKLAKSGAEWFDVDWSSQDDPWDWPCGLPSSASEREQAAKKAPEVRGYGRDAIAVTLYKRSGEMIQWGARNSSPAWDLHRFFQQHSRKGLEKNAAKPMISGRFAHRLAELLRPISSGTCLCPGNKKIVGDHFCLVVNQQTGSGRDVADDAALKEHRNTLIKLADAALNDLVAHRRPMDEFLNLFLTEVFIARQGD